MSCILSISGTEFDVDAYLARADWADIDIHTWHIGDPRGIPGRRPPHVDAGFSCVASNAAFEDFEKQQEETIAFLHKYSSNLKLLQEFKVDYWRCIDFGLSTVPPNNFSRTYIIKPELGMLISEHKLDMWMSNYFTDNSDYLKRKAKKRWPISKR